ncbi:MAG: hypothetical protein L0177_10175 [Chloroflexi bacterium]|nr:hypothetical protein [Chloroflexota bacterium]
MAQIEFDDTTTQKLFGHEAAEDEEPSRLREYYFKSTVFKHIANELPLRILVGHKGIGKSALFKVAMNEDKEKQKLSVLIQPNDVTNLGRTSGDFLTKIGDWSRGLRQIITEKSNAALRINLSGMPEEAATTQEPLLKFLARKWNSIEEGQYDPQFTSEVMSFLDNPSITAYIDDLDRGWESTKEGVNRISALLNAVRDLANHNPGLRFRVALRSDVYYLVRTSDESTDKIEGSVVWHSWTNHEIFVVLVKRIETFLGRSVDESKLLKTPQGQLAGYLEPIMDSRFTGVGHWSNAPMYQVLMSLIRRRPRDLVKLCSLGARHAHDRGAARIQTVDFKGVFDEYSQGRMQDTVNEYRSELPDIERLLISMRPSRRERLARLGYVYNTSGLLEKLKNAIEAGSFAFSNGRTADTKDLAAFLYKINFLTARKVTPDGIVRKYFEDNRYLSSKFADFGFDWEVHPAYRWALQPQSIEDIFSELQLSIGE